MLPFCMNLASAGRELESAERTEGGASPHTYIRYVLQATSTKLINASPKLNYPYELQALKHALVESLKLSSKML